MIRCFLNDPEEKSVEEQRVGKATQAVEQHHQRERMLGQPKAQESHMTKGPPQCANRHDAACAIDFSQNAGQPARKGSGGTVNGEEHPCLLGGESNLGNVFCKECDFNAVARHVQGNSDVAP